MNTEKWRGTPFLRGRVSGLLGSTEWRIWPQGKEQAIPFLTQASTDPSKHRAAPLVWPSPSGTKP